MSRIADIEAVFQTETERAICVRSDEAEGNVWLPKSQCEMEPEEASRGDIVTITGPEWLLIEKGLI